MSSTPLFISGESLGISTTVQVAKVLLDFGANPNDADSTWAAVEVCHETIKCGENMW
jgi:hypothetical protein